MSVDIQSVTFRIDGTVEISFVNELESTDTMALMRTVAFEEAMFVDEVGTVREELMELLDEVQIALRNEDVRADRLKRLAKRMAQEEILRSGLPPEEETD